MALSSLGPTALLLTGLPYIPFYLVTAEFFAAVRAHMRPEGLLMMNLFDNSPKHGLLVSTVATLERVFPRVVVLSVGYGNRMLLALPKETTGSFDSRAVQQVRGRRSN